MVQKIRSTRRRRLQKSLVFNRNIYIRLATHFLKRKNIYTLDESQHKSVHRSVSRWTLVTGLWVAVSGAPPGMPSAGHRYAAVLDGLLSKEVHERHRKGSSPGRLTLYVPDPPLVVLFSIHHYNLSLCKRQLIRVVSVTVIYCFHPLRLYLRLVTCQLRFAWHWCGRLYRHCGTRLGSRLRRGVRRCVSRSRIG